MKLYFAILTAIIIFCGCENGKMPIKEVTEIPDQAIENFTVTETQGGKKKWVIDAPSAKIYEDQKKAFLTAPIIKFYEKGKHVSTLEADKGSVDMATYDIIGEGKCFLQTEKGESLDTTNLRYNSQEQRIVTDENVVLVKGGSTIYGKGLEATPDLETIIIKNQRTEITE